MGFPGGSVVKNPPDSRDVGKIPWRRKWEPTLVFSPGESHGQRSWWATVHRVAKSWTDMTERLSLHLLIYIHVSSIFIIYMR